MSHPKIAEHRLHSNDLDEISHFINARYADHQFTPQLASRCTVDMVGYEWSGVSTYEVVHETPFVFKSEEPRDNYLIVACNRGGSVYSDGKNETLCSAGNCIPISTSGSSTCSTKEEGFDHLSMIVDFVKLNTFIAEWIGRPVESPLLFDLQPMPKVLSAQWTASANCLHQMMLIEPMPDAAVQALTEHMFKILVTGHPNSCSGSLLSEHYADEQRARSAVNMIKADPMHWHTLGRLARELGCSIDVLEKGIRRLTGLGFLKILYDARLNAVYRALSSTNDLGFAETLRAYGFSPSAKFVRTYSERFHESPSTTYRLNPNATESVTCNFEGHNSICEHAIIKYIDSYLDKPLCLANLASALNMSEYETIEAFKGQFYKTPIQYVIERRLERARWLLEHTSSSILAIAIECGFGSQSYMTATMRKHFGETPRQIRLSKR